MSFKISQKVSPSFPETQLFLKRWRVSSRLENGHLNLLDVQFDF